MNWHGHDIPDPDWVSDCGQAVLYNRDCLDVLPLLPDGCQAYKSSSPVQRLPHERNEEGVVDGQEGGIAAAEKQRPGWLVTIADPPYGVGLGGHAGGRETRHGLLVKAWGYEDSPENFKNVVVPAIRMCLSLSKRAVVFGVPPMAWLLPAPSAIGGIFVEGAVGRNKWGWSNLIHCFLYGIAPNLNLGANPTAIRSTVAAEKTGHPTTKPLNWMVWAVSLGSASNDVVIDPFAGSGTTGVACARLGRKFIGIEIEPKYFEIAKTRIDQELRQGKLAFDAGGPKR
jgi:hypothetical protein